MTIFLCPEGVIVADPACIWRVKGDGLEGGQYDKGERVMSNKEEESE